MKSLFLLLLLVSQIGLANSKVGENLPLDCEVMLSSLSGSSFDLTFLSCVDICLTNDENGTPSICREPLSAFCYEVSTAIQLSTLEKYKQCVLNE